MIPKTITHIDCMPLTTNDKVDTTRLPNPSPIQQSNKVYSEPSNEIEQTFVDVFGEVLKQNDVGVDYDFFELGGNSLEAMLVVSHQNDLAIIFQCRHYTNIKPCQILLIICTKINNH